MGSASPVFEEAQEFFVDNLWLLFLAEVSALWNANAPHIFGHPPPYVQEIEDATV